MSKDHEIATLDMRANMIRSSELADLHVRQAIVCALALGHTIEQIEPLRQALGWLAVHANVTEDSRETEEIVAGVMPE